MIGRHVGDASAMSSTPPTFVVPAVATAAKMPSTVLADSSETARRSASPVMRPRSSPGISMTSTSITTRRACLTDEWVSSVRQTAQRGGRRERAARGPLPAQLRERTGWRPSRLARISAGRGWKTGQFGDPAQRLIFGVDRPGALEPRSAVDIRRADEHVERSCRRRWRTRDEGPGIAGGRRTGTPARVRPSKVAAPRRRRARGEATVAPAAASSCSGAAGRLSGCIRASRSEAAVGECPGGALCFRRVSVHTVSVRACLWMMQDGLLFSGDGSPSSVMAHR